MKCFLALIFILSLSSCTKNETAKDPAASPKAGVDQYSFEQLQSAALYSAQLSISDVDAQFAKKPREQILDCDPKEPDMNNWSMALKSLIDSRITSEKAAYLAQDPKTRTRLDKYVNCSKHCLCGSYADLIGSIDENSLTAQDLSLIESMRKSHASLEKKDMMACAQQNGWFCKSELSQFLMKAQ